MQISYDLFQAQHRQKIHTHYLVFHVGFPFILLRQWFPQVSSEIRSMVHGSLFCNSNLFSGNISIHSLKLVLFWFRIPKTETEPLGSSWHRMVYSWRSFIRSPCSHRSNSSPLFFFLRLLLKSHQVCRNLLFVTLAGCTQMLKPQHCIHSIASLKLVRISFLRVSQQEEIRMFRVISHHHHPSYHRYVLIGC